MLPRPDVEQGGDAILNSLWHAVSTQSILCLTGDFSIMEGYQEHLKGTALQYS